MCPGLVYRSPEGFHVNKSKYLDLSRIAAPERDVVDNHRYFIEGGMGNVESKRGCPQGCIYCADPVGKGKKLRLRSPKSVADEIEDLLRGGIDHLHFCDSEFNIPENHARDICLELVERGLGDRIRWYAYASPKPFSQELATLCKRAGCVGIDFGVDSGCDAMLRRLGRDFFVEDLSRTAEICHQEGIIFMYDLLLGGPGETRESMKETIDTMKRLSPDRIGVSFGVRIFPQTKLAALVTSQGLLKENPNIRGRLWGTITSLHLYSIFPQTWDLMHLNTSRGLLEGMNASSSCRHLRRRGTTTITTIQCWWTPSMRDTAEPSGIYCGG